MKSACLQSSSLNPLQWAILALLALPLLILPHAASAQEARQLVPLLKRSAEAGFPTPQLDRSRISRIEGCSYDLDGYIDNFQGKRDSDGDGYWEEFSFNANFDASDSDCTLKVYIAVYCVELDRFVAYSEDFELEDYELAYITIDQSDFSTWISGHQSLTFAFGLFDADDDALLADDERIEGGPIKVEQNRPGITVTAEDSAAAEPSNTGTFRIRRAGDKSNDLTVYFTLGGSAQNGTDYQSINGSTTIKAGSDSKTITVTPKDDSQVEGRETVDLTLSSNSSYILGSPKSATVYIDDNDSAPTYSVKITNLSRSSCQVAELQSGKAVYTDRTYTFSSPIPSALQGHPYIRTANADKDATGSSFLTFDVDRDVTVFMALSTSMSSPPDWMSGWGRTDWTLSTNDGSRRVYSRNFSAGRVTLGGNRDSNDPTGVSMYSVVVSPRQSVPTITPTSTPSPTATPTPTPTQSGSVGISNLSRSTYRTGTFDAGRSMYVDRAFTFSSPVPSTLKGHPYILTANNDKDNTGSSFLGFDVDRDVTVYVLLNEKLSNPPSWMSGWTPFSEKVQTSDGGRRVHARDFPRGRVTLGGNRDPDDPTGNSMYSVVVTPRQGGATPTPSATVGVSGISRSGYTTGTLRPGAPVHTDRSYVFSDPIPFWMTGATYILTRNDEKTATHESFLFFDVDRPVTVYVGIDNRYPHTPPWMADWMAAGMRVYTNDLPKRLYSRNFPAGRVVLGGPSSTTTTAQSTYSIIIVPENAGPDIWIHDINQPGYTVSLFGSGNNVYNDRSFLITDPFPMQFAGQPYIRTRNDDKGRTDNPFLSFRIEKPARVYLLQDSRFSTQPDWFGGWSIGSGFVNTTDFTRRVFYKDFGAGTITLGANRDSSMPTGYSMYSVVVVSRDTLQASGLLSAQSVPVVGTASPRQVDSVPPTPTPSITPTPSPTATPTLTPRPLEP